jgi:hypothetical protein
MPHKITAKLNAQQIIAKIRKKKRTKNLCSPMRKFQQGVQSGEAKTQQRWENVKMDRTHLCCHLLLHRAPELMSGLEKVSSQHVDLGFAGPSRGTKPEKLV